MELLPHLLEHAFEDTIYLVPFLLITYILLELLEHKAGDKAAVLVRKAGIAGPLLLSFIRETTQSYALCLYVFAFLFIISFIIAIILKIKTTKKEKLISSKTIA